MSDRDRLREILDKKINLIDLADSEAIWTSEKISELADYLLSNGVAVSPDKVEDTAYELKSCPFCGGKLIVSPFTYNVLELPKPIKLFGRWSLIKQRYRELPITYTVDCENFCEGWRNSKIFILEETKGKAIEAWNRALKERGKEE